MTTLKRKPLSRMSMLLWRLCVLLFVCICALVPATPVFAGAKPPSDRTEQNAKLLRLNLQDLLENWHKLSEVAQLDAVEQIIAQGKADIALQILEQANFKNGASNIRARFLRGLALKGRGENQAAIEIFRQLLADNPNFSRVRLELAHALFLAEEDRSAQHHFDLVLGDSASNPNLERTVRSYLHAINNRRIWNFSSYITIAPSTNLNQGSETEIVYVNGLPFQVSESGVKTSGIGIAGGGQGSYRLPLAERIDLIASAGAHIKRYEEEFFNDLLASVSLGPRFRFDRGTLGVYAIAQKRWFSDSDYSKSFGALVSGSLRLNAKNIVFADLQCTNKRYEKDWNGGDQTYQNGHQCSLSGRLEHRVDVATMVRFLAGGEHLNTEREHLDNVSWSIGAGVYRELPFGVSLYAQGKFTKADFDGDFPFMDEARDDKRLDVSLQVTKRDWNIRGFAPKFQYTFTHNRSNADFYDYDAHGANVTLTKRF